MPTPRQVWAWVAGCGLLVPSQALAQDRTEREVVELIVREGPQARAIQAGVAVVRREQAARLAYPNPAVSYMREGAGFTEFLQVEQAVPLMGLRGVLARAGVAANEAAEAERDAQLWALRADAAAMVSRVAAADARLGVANAFVSDVRRLVEVVRIREREGEGSRFDRLRAEHELREAQLTATAASIEAADVRAALTALLPDTFGIGRIGWTPALRPVALPESLLARATSSRADLRALDRLASRAGLEETASRRAKLPSPVLFGGLKRSDGASGREAGGVFGVSFTMPLLDAGGREAARWSAERDRLAATRAALEQQIRTEIVRATSALTLRQAVLAESTVSAADDLMPIADVAYREGEIGILELLDAARTASRARSRTIDIQLDMRLAEIALERAVGDVLWP
jgi:cobalt-zinc-cadmium efflux system outer membrane protein